ncbi:GNAT family N-acetyltransferase [Phenylobacterium sp.]|uniref:GNAT family N-acetyltransferase n=1 Tax=Phenylobacterium sp. TaxID=1871053 RepID=UPI002F3E83BB
MILQTERLALHELTQADAPFILELLTSRGFMDNIGDRGVRDLAGAAGYIERQREGYGVNGFGLWGADVKATGERAGICGFVKREGLEHPDVGYAFLERFWGRGYATEAAAAALAYGRQTLGLQTIVAITAPHNKGSAAVLEKIGMRFTGMVTMPGYDTESSYFTT